MLDSIAGTDWRPEELQAVIADYFDMLAADLSGRPYVKAHHRAGLVAKFGRSNGSIEYKYQNISAVLDKLGASWIAGYKPANRYQGALVTAIDQYLSTNRDALDSPATDSPHISASTEVFVSPPIANLDAT